MSRRSFLLCLLGLSLSGAGWVIYDRRRPQADPAPFVADLIGHRFSYLEIDPEDLRRFADEHVARCDAGQLAAIRRMAAEGSSPGSTTGPVDYRRRNLEREIAALFLLSTDFFLQDGEPESVHYVAYADPYELGCANPLSRQAEQDAA